LRWLLDLGKDCLKDFKISQKDHHGNVTKERLEEYLPYDVTTLDVIIHIIRMNSKFNKEQRIPIDQVKVILYYGLAGRKDMTTDEVAQVMAALEINYDYELTGKLLEELADDGLLQYEVRDQTIWKFSKISRNDFPTHWA